MNKTEILMREFTTIELLEFLEQSQTLQYRACQLLAERFPCDNQSDNLAFRKHLEDDFVVPPEWAVEECDYEDDTLFYYAVDSETNSICLEPADDGELCYLSDMVLDLMDDFDVCLKKMQEHLYE